MPQDLTDWDAKPIHAKISKTQDAASICAICSLAFRAVASPSPRLLDDLPNITNNNSHIVAMGVK